MRPLKYLAISIVLLSSVIAAAKDKKKFLLPTDVLRARTVLVVVDPQAGMAIDNSNANRAARDAGERELMNWGRFEIVTDVSISSSVV